MQTQEETIARWADTVTGIDVVSRAGFTVPPFEIEPSGDPTPFNMQVLTYLRELWRANGFNVGVDGERDHRRVLVDALGLPKLLITNQYKGLTRIEFSERRQHLTRRVVDTDKKEIVGAPPMGGLRGVEQYRVVPLAATTVIPFDYRRTMQQGIAISQAHGLGNEMTDFKGLREFYTNLPQGGRSFKYPNHPTGQPVLFIDGESFRPDTPVHQRRGSEYLQEWAEKLVRLQADLTLG